MEKEKETLEITKYIISNYHINDYEKAHTVALQYSQLGWDFDQIENTIANHTIRILIDRYEMKELKMKKTKM